MKTSVNERIVILGISDKPERYSFKAHQKLLDNGFTNQVGVSPKNLSLADIELVDQLDKVTKQVHTLTLYIGVERLEPIIDQILALSPKRIITNPGTENPNLIDRAIEQGIEVVQGCTLVMLDNDQF
ncbi:CoA-binding protein [Vibrio sp. TH_r3]|uniref:CoA-binding protein n=1 Tax=Vibrio sp. TH_r3 TaxID=3082084 RepID=UPI002952A342|nr:CoA-binding protein [Vibrio sp. TH_r3]MDV7106183.1 CoA-binding protein [Vibrio sp. TH_r3]